MTRQEEMDPVINEDLGNIVQYKCRWMHSTLNRHTDMVLYVHEHGVIADLLEEAKRQAELAQNGSGRLRILEIVNSKIYCVLEENRLLHSITSDTRAFLRIEEIPMEELHIAEDELLVPVAHFQQGGGIYFFGVPFLLKIKQNEPFEDVKDRIRRRLHVSNEEFETYDFAIIVMNRPEPVNFRINLEDFLAFPCQDRSAFACLPFLGIEHTY